MKKLVLLSVLLSASSCFALPVYAGTLPSTAHYEKVISAMPQFRHAQPRIIDSKNFNNLSVIHLAVRGGDHSDAFVIFTPGGKSIDIDDYAILSSINIKANPEYKVLASKFPNISVWPGNHDYPKYEKLADGAQQLQFTYRLLNGCHACAVGGITTVSFNFDTAGNFINTNLLQLAPASSVGG